MLKTTIFETIILPFLIIDNLCITKKRHRFAFQIEQNLQSSKLYYMYLNTPSVQEHELVLRLINDDESAFCELYSVYRNRLIYFAMKFLKSQVFAEDIFQDTFTVVWQSRKFINPDASFSTYLYTIMRNRILNTLRDLENEQQLKNNIFAQAIDANDSTEETIHSKDFMELINQAMQKLTPRQREIFNMSRNREMSHKEIAETLGISVNTVQEHISTSLKIIRTYFTKNNGPYADLLLLLLILPISFSC